MNGKYEQLRTRINELLPDRVKLEFGCEVETKRGVKPYVGREDILQDGYDEGNIQNVDEGCGCCSSHDRYAKGDYKILGKPLQIEDVLRAIARVQIFEYKIIIRADGLMFNDGEEVCCLDLTKPLSAPENEEACGEDFVKLERRMGGYWAAFGCKDYDDNNTETRGSTPEEAVARLWLALNKHE